MKEVGGGEGEDYNVWTRRGRRKAVILMVVVVVVMIRDLDFVLKTNEVRHEKGKEGKEEETKEEEKGKERKNTEI